MPSLLPSTSSSREPLVPASSSPALPLTAASSLPPLSYEVGVDFHPLSASIAELDLLAPDCPPPSLYFHEISLPGFLDALFRFAVAAFSDPSLPAYLQDLLENTKFIGEAFKQILGSLPLLGQGSFSSVDDLTFANECSQQFQLQLRSLLISLKAVNASPCDANAQSQLARSINELTMLVTKLCMLIRSISREEINLHQNSLFSGFSKLVMELRASPPDAPVFAEATKSSATTSILLADNIRYFSLGMDLDASVYLSIFEQVATLEELIEGMTRFFLTPLFFCFFLFSIN